MIGSGTPSSHNNAPLVKSMICPPLRVASNTGRQARFPAWGTLSSAPRMVSTAITTASLSRNVLHLIHFRSERTNRNRANQRGESPNNLFRDRLGARNRDVLIGMLFSAPSSLAAARASRTAPAAVQLLPWTRPESSCACQSPLPAFDARRLPQVHAIWFQPCFRTVSSAQGCTILDFAAIDAPPHAETGSRSRSPQGVRKCVSSTPCCACATSIPR
jgi:hypothetical protein